MPMFTSTLPFNDLIWEKWFKQDSADCSFL